jgi:hypothetical protein
MESQKETAEHATMSELDHAQLTQIAGGISVSDEYCTTPLSLPRHLPLVAVQTQEFTGAIAAGSR